MSLDAPANRLGPRQLWRAGVAIAAGLALTYFVLAVSLSGVFGERRPELALDWRSGDARANAALASQMMAGPDEASPDEIRRRALDALRRDPTAIDAVRVLATLDMQTDRDKARTLMAYALDLSRRDLSTHLWYIEDYATRSSVSGALFHYDAALRTSRRAGAMLMPVLVSASAQPRVVAELDRILARKPVWREQFLESLVENGTGFDAWLSLPNKYLDPNVAGDATLIQVLLNRLVAAGHYAEADRFSSTKAGTPPGETRVRNGAFERQPQFTPFDWMLVNEQDFTAQIAVPGSEHPDLALVLDVASGRGGPLASQLLRLAGGRYRLSAVVGGADGDGKVYLTLRCVETNQPLLRLDAPRADAAGKPAQATFAVPGASCPAQWLEIAAEANASEQQPWVDSVAVTPLQ